MSYVREREKKWVVQRARGRKSSQENGGEKVRVQREKRKNEGRDGKGGEG